MTHSDSPRQKTILIVEDNDKNLKLARDILQAKGFMTLEAVTGEEGVRQTITHIPNLVLMDIQLPGMNGIEAFKAIRANPPTKHIPVVAFTASVTALDRCEVTAAGFDAFLGKPIELKEFVATIQRLTTLDEP